MVQKRKGKSRYFCKIVEVISQTEDLTLQKRICSFGFGIGCEKNRVFRKYHRRVDIVKEP